MKKIEEVSSLEKSTGITDSYRITCLGILQVLFPELERVILFGSRARGKFLSGSDVDLALDCGKRLENPLRFIEAKDVLNALRAPYQCDLSDYHKATGIFKEMIDEEGIIWIKSPSMQPR